MSNEQHYDVFDEFYCRDLVPLSGKLLELATDGNRYHYMLAVRLAATQAARWLVKPATGWIDAAHQALFTASYKQNTLNAIGLMIGASGYASGKVYANLDADTALEVVADGIQPILDWTGKASGFDDVRNVFEKWHLSGAGLRSAYRVQGIEGKIAAGDKMYTYLLAQAGGDKSKVNIKLIEARYPGYKLPDGSKPTGVLDVGSLV